MSDKCLREKSAKSDTKMRPTPIAESNFESYDECVREETIVGLIFKPEEQSSKSCRGFVEIHVC
jgi:hypothetical protein